MRLDTAVHPMLLAEPSHNTREAREKMVELMFEKYNAPGEQRVGAAEGPAVLCCAMPCCAVLAWGEA
jgi:actin-like protein 6A